MTKAIQKIKSPIEEELQIFEQKFKEAMKSDVALLDKITYYIVKRKGKQMRPMFVLLAAKLCGQINESTYRAASLIELLHTATLVHDDVVDDANERRGFFSINALWKNKIAVLVGDYLLSQGLLLSIDNGEFEVLRQVSVAVREMSEGELLQIEKARRLDITEEVYFEVIRKKTASLIASCCASGACSVSRDTVVIENMRKFGELVGLAFQIKDDIFDYGSADKIGKPTGIDIKERKMTLPLIYTLGKVSKAEKRFIINVVKNHNENKSKVAEVVKLVIDHGGIRYAENKMHQIKSEALTMLFTFKPCDERDALEALVNYTISREK